MMRTVLQRVALCAVWAVTAACLAANQTTPPADDAEVIEDASSLPSDSGSISMSDAGLMDTGGVQPDTGADASTPDLGIPDAAVDAGAPPADSGVVEPTGEPRYVFVGDELLRGNSADGVSWQRTTPTATYEDLLRDVTFGNGRFFAVGGGGVTSVLLTSDDGENWTRQRTPEGWIGAVAWLPTIRAVVIAGSNGYRYRSLDRGTTFLNPGEYIDNGHFRDAAAGNGRVVAVGEVRGEVGLSSATEDGIEWTPEQEGGAPFTSIAFGNGVFVAVGQDGRISSSTDGVSWTNQNLAGRPFIPHVAFGNGRFLLAAGGGVFASTNGVIWQEEGPGPAIMIFGDGLWVGVSSLGETFTSPDGQAWTPTSGRDIPTRSSAFGFVSP